MVKGRVGEVLTVMALNFALIPFGSISMALLRRDMNFRAIMFITVASTFAHSGISVLLAAMGFGFISLAWGGRLRHGDDRVRRHDRQPRRLLPETDLRRNAARDGVQRAQQHCLDRL